MQSHESSPAPSDTICLRLLTEYLAQYQDVNAGTSAQDSAEPGEMAESDPEGSSNHESRLKWIPRIRDLDDFDAGQLSSAHGRLIAQGMLNFQVEDRSSGLCYRVTPQGRALLASSADTQPDSAA